MKQETPAEAQFPFHAVTDGGTHLGLQLVDQVRHGLSVEVSCGRGQWRVDVGMGVDPHHAEPAHRRSVTVDGADGQAEERETEPF